MSLYFSEGFVRSSERVSVRRIGGGTLTLPAPQSGAAVIHQPLPPRLHGVFVVSWRVLSDDGHLSLGEFAFAVGSTGALPAVRNSFGGTSWSAVAASWLVFIGLALGLGGLISERLVWRRTQSAQTVVAAPVAIGVALAAVGALLELLLLAGNQRGSGLFAGLHGGALANALGTRPGGLTLALLIALVAAGALAALRSLRVAAVVPLLAAVAFVAVRGHSGTSGHGWAVAADSIHLAAVAAWLGALAHLVVIAVRAGAPAVTFVAGARRYSRLALPTVLIIVVSGVLTAIPEFRSVGAVVSSGYGRTLLIKAGLIGVALLLAAGARRRALPANPHPRLPLLRRLTVVEATTLAGVLVAAAVLVNAAPPRAPSAARASTAPLGPPPVAEPALRLADLAGQLLVGLTAGPGKLQFMVVPPSEQPPAKLMLSAAARRPDGRSLDLYPRPCGSGCFSLRFALNRGVTVVIAKASSNQWRGGEVRFAIPWPLAPARPQLLRRVAATMRALRSLTLTEAVSSGPGSSTPPTAYTVSGRQFMQTELFGGGGVDVRPLAQRGGLTELTFALPGSNVWYRIWIDRAHRLRRELIIDPGHRIVRTFNYGSKARASPPGSASTSATPALPPPAGLAPPTGALVLARELGDLALALAARPAGDGVQLKTSVLAPDGSGLAGLRVSYRLSGRRAVRTVAALACGPGCYGANIASVGKPVTVSVQLAGAGRAASTASFRFPARWPAPDARALVARARRVFANLRSLVIDERLASSPSNVLVTRYELAAPNELRYQIRGGDSAIVIGGRRWDRQGRGRWQESTASPIRQPAPTWDARFSDAHLLGNATLDGRRVSIVSFYDPVSKGWFTLWIDTRGARTLELKLVAAAHFMHHRYSGFNTRLTIKPPQAATGG